MKKLIITIVSAVLINSANAATYHMPLDKRHYDGYVSIETYQGNDNSGGNQPEPEPDNISGLTFNVGYDYRGDSTNYTQSRISQEVTNLQIGDTIVLNGGLTLLTKANNTFEVIAASSGSYGSLSYAYDGHIFELPNVVSISILNDPNNVLLKTYTYPNYFILGWQGQATTFVGTEFRLNF